MTTVEETIENEDSGWLRAAVMGGMDGLTTSSAVTIGLVGSGMDVKGIAIAGLLAGLAGSCSMAMGEWVSVNTHNEQPGAIQFNPYIAAGASFICFAIGSLVPLLPVLLGTINIWLLCVVGGLALFIAGAVATRWTSRSWYYGGIRQLIFGVIATIVTYALGAAIG